MLLLGNCFIQFFMLCMVDELTSLILLTYKPIYLYICFFNKKSSASISRVLYYNPMGIIVLVIYLLHKSPHASSVLPSIASLLRTRAGNPQSMVYANLQSPDETASMSPYCWWSLTPPSHPYRKSAVIFFFQLLLSPVASILGSGVPFTARTFLSSIRTSDKPRHCFYFFINFFNFNFGIFILSPALASFIPLLKTST